MPRRQPPHTVFRATIPLLLLVLLLAGPPISFTGRAATLPLAVPPFAPTGYLRTWLLPGEYWDRFTVAPGGAIFYSGADLIRSDDGGHSWHAMDDPAYYADKGPIAFSPSFDQDGVAFLGLDYGTDALRLSSDGGYSWRSPIQQVTGPIVAIGVSPSFPAHPFVYVATTASTGVYLLRSGDGGEHWEDITPAGGLKVASILPSPALMADQTLFLQMADGSLLRSEDGGGTWSPAGAGLGLSTSVTISPNYPTDAALYATTNYDVYESIDRGGSWHSVYTYPSGQWLAGIAAAPDFATSRMLLALRSDGSYDKLVRSTNAGRSWQIVLDSGPYQFGFSRAYAQDHTLYARTFDQMLASSDAGDTWELTSRNYGGSEYRFERLVVSPSLDGGGVIFAAPGSGEYDAVLRSTDVGQTWTAISFPEAGRSTPALSPAFTSDHNVLAAVGNHLLVSSSLGDQWAPLGSLLPISPTDLLRLSPGYPGDQTVFVADYMNGVYRSTDSGQTWQLLTGSIGPFVTDLEVSPGYSGDLTLFVSTYNTGLYRSSDGGSSWTHLTSPTFSPDFNVELSPDYPVDHTVFVNNNGMSSGGAFRSTDQGDTWVDITGNELDYFLPVAAVSPYFAQDQTVIIAHESGPIYMSEEAGNSWFALEGIPEVGGYGLNYGLAISSLGGRPCPVASAPNGVYVYRWPSLLPVAPVFAAVEPDSLAPIVQQRALAADMQVSARWETRESADWLMVAPPTGTLPANLALTLDPTVVTDTVRTDLLLDVYWSYHQTETVTVPVTLLFIRSQVLLPLVVRNTAR